MKKIILIEETNVLKVRLENMFRRNNFTNFEALSSNFLNEKYISSIHDDVEIYILDLDNRRINGVEFISMLHNLNKENPTPIIALSKSASVSMLKKVVRAGCSDFVIKPFDNNSLLMKVKKIMHNEPCSAAEENLVSDDIIKEHIDTQLNWNKAFMINIESIDDEHRSIVEKYEELYKLMREGKGLNYYTELLSFLKDYVNTHFDNEEVLHKEANFPLASEHRKIHEAFKSTVQKAYDEGQDKEVKPIDLIKISLFVRNWLVHHILIEDKKFGDHVNKNTP